MVLVQRVAPFERVWLFLLPVYLALASAGLVRLGRGRVPDVAVPGVAVVLAGVMAYASLTSGAIRTSPETGFFPDAEAIAGTLRGRLSADDAVVCAVPAAEPQLAYYFARLGLPPAVLVRQPEQARRLYVVAAPNDPPVVPGWSRPTEIARFAGSVLLALERVEPA